MRTLLAASLVLGLASSGCAVRDRASGERVTSTSSRWTNAGDMSVARTRHGLAPVAGGGAIVAGGFDGSMNYLASAEVWNPAASKWTLVAPMSTPHADYPLVGLADGRVAAIGGGYQFSGAEIYDVAADAWTRSGNTLRHDVIHHAAAPLKDGRVLVAGGGYDDGSGIEAASTDADLYDPKTNSFTPTGSLQTARHWPVLVTLASGDVLAVGGRQMTTSGWNGISSAEIWSASAGTWTPTAGPLHDTRSQHVAVRMLDGRVLVAGGEEGNGSQLSTAEIFDPSTGHFRTAPPMSTARDEASAILLADGRVLVVGGFDGNDTLSTTEIFDPSTSTWSAGPALDKARFNARLLSVGGILVAGGEYAKVGGAEYAYATTVILTPDAADAGVDAPAGDTGALADAATGPDAAAAPDAPSGTPTVQGSAIACTKAGDCTSGFCVDGVCCDAKCDAPCSSCALPWSPGRCAPQPYGYDLRHACGAAGSCSATCGTSGACVPVRGGEQCAPSTCTDRSHGVGPSTCVSAGASCPTEAAVPFDCGAYACDPSFGACLSRCSSSDDCAPDYACDVPSGTCTSAPPSNTGGGCATGGAPIGVAAPVALALALSIAARRRRARLTRASARTGARAAR